MALGHRLWRARRMLAVLVVAGCGQAADLGPPVEPGPPAALRMRSGDGQTAAVGDTLPLPVVVQVSDSAGRPVAGVTVTFAAGGQGAAFVPAEALTDDQGRASASWVLGRRPGSAEASAAIAGLPPLPLSATAVAGPPDPSTSTISATPDSLLVGDSTVIRVVARDEFGNPVAGATVSLSLGGSGGTLTQPTVTDAEGVALGGLLALSPGPDTVSAKVEGVALSGTATVAVASAPPVVTSVSVTPADAATLVGASVRLDAVVRDASGAPMDGVTLTWRTSDASVATVSANGTVTGRSPGSATISAEAEGKSGSAQLTVSYGEGVVAGVTYCTIGGVPDSMDVFVPSDTVPRPLPVAVHVHGGGWTSGTRSTGAWFTRIRDELLARGYLVASLSYRLAPRFKYPSQIEDVKCAVRHLRANASRYGLAPARIGAWGGSAGGQLVALLGTADASAGFDDVGGFQGTSSRVRAVVAMSAITDFTHPEELNDDYSREFLTWPQPDSPEMIEASPVTHVTSDDAPFLFLVGNDDALVLPAQSVRMDSLLAAAGIESSVLRVANADHNLESTGAPIQPDAAAIVGRAADFFDRHLR